jgi:hypothetical protein
MYPDKEFDIREFVKMGLWPEPGLAPDGADAAAGVGDGVGGVAAAAAGDSSDAVQQGGIEERLEELELMEELDDMPDVPAVDLV